MVSIAAFKKQLAWKSNNAYTLYVQYFRVEGILAKYINHNYTFVRYKFIYLFQFSTSINIYITNILTLNKCIKVNAIKRNQSDLEFILF